jgi:hypothetical protein
MPGTSAAENLCWADTGRVAIAARMRIALRMWAEKRGGDEGDSLLGSFSAKKRACRERNAKFKIQNCAGARLRENHPYAHADEESRNLRRARCLRAGAGNENSDETKLDP